MRQQNEDRIFFDDALGLYVVSDGIGGRRRGDVAAEISTNTIRESIESSAGPAAAVTWPYGYLPHMSLSGNRLVTAVKIANREVWRRGEESLQFLGMGATVTAVLVDGTTAAVANVGDSRVYWFHGGRLQRLSVDDSTSMGFPAAAGGTSVVRTMLTRSAGSQENVDVHLKEVELSAGDLLLLCSDGLHGYVAEDRIAALIGTAQPIAARTEALIADTRSAGAPDNVSAVLVQFFGPSL